MKLVPTASQTVGPYFRIGLDHLTSAATNAEAKSVTVCGCVLDGERKPVSDALLELWQADASGSSPNPDVSGRPAGFVRAATDHAGRFSCDISRPAAVPFPDGQLQAPHLVVLLFARGLMRHLITRMYFPEETANDADPVLQSIAEERRATLIARRQSVSPEILEWDIVLQGKDETVFFAW